MKESNVEYLLREATDERALPVGQRFALDDERWKAIFERLQIGAGLRVFLSRAEARRDLTVEANDDRTDQWMGSQVTIDGGAEIDFLDGETVRASVDHAVLFRPAGRRAAYSLRAGTRFHSAGWGLDLERVERLFDGNVPQPLRPLLDRKLNTSRIVSSRADRRLRALARDMFAPGLAGPLRALMIEGSVLQLLAVQAALAGGDGAARAMPAEPSAREREALHEARQRLLSDMRQPPTLGELAAAVGLSEKRLNAGFRALFGGTVFEVLRNERLDHARQVLAAQQAPLKEVAFRVGYAHVANFITAFTHRFGAPPGRYLSR